MYTTLYLTVGSASIWEYVIKVSDMPGVAELVARLLGG